MKQVEVKVKVERGKRLEVRCWKPWAMFLLQASFFKPLTSNHISLSLNLLMTLAGYLSILLGHCEGLWLLFQ